MRLVDAATMRALDRAAIQDFGIPGIVLMENAGRGAAELMLERWRAPMAGGVSVLCGRGNNGGDGYVIARHLHNAGFDARVYVFSPREAIQGDAAVNLAVTEAMCLPIRFVDDADWTAVRQHALSAPVIVDALLGTGLRSEVTGLLRRVIDDVNRAGRIVLAVDIPSGLDAASGRPLGAAIRADVTATFGLAKLGMVLDTAQALIGELRVLDISLPRSIADGGDSYDRLLEASDVRAMLPSRPSNGHKGTFGHLAVVAGSVGKVGAAVLACHSALRSGVGLVTLATPRGAGGYLTQLRPEIMIELLPDGGTGHFTADSLPGLLNVLERKDAVAVGPGLSTGEGVGALLTGLLAKCALPMIIDADGLNALAGDPAAWGDARGPRVVTPHPGEAARLLELSPPQVLEDRVAAVRAIASRTGGVAVLKGARTLVARPDGRLSVNPTGNPGMGTAGSGDVLTGLIGGLLAQKLGAEAAAASGVYLHGLAGDLAAATIGGRALVAGDLTEHMGAAFKHVAGSQA